MISFDKFKELSAAKQKELKEEYELAIQELNAILVSDDLTPQARLGAMNRKLDLKEFLIVATSRGKRGERPEDKLRKIVTGKQG